MVVRIVVVDRQPLFSRGLELLLPAVSEDRVQVVAVTDAADAAAGLARRHAPDLVLVDLGLGPPGGLRAAAAVLRAEPRTAVLAMVAGHTEEDDLLAEEALRVGVAGVLVKAQEPEALLAPLLAAADGWAVVPPRLLNRLASCAGRARRHDGPLAAAQRRLWALIAAGTSTQQIAARLHVSERTVKRLTAALLRRLGVANRTEAAALAGRAGVAE
ncbi:MAG: response regulator transcription factor [Pseudonocardia sp.]|nr:response regulator transcription factor [Pseudonocardia sp.]